MTTDNGPQNRTVCASPLSCVYGKIRTSFKQETALLISDVECGRKSRWRKREVVCGRTGGGRPPLTSALVDRTNTEHPGLLETVRSPTFSKPVWWRALYLSLNISKST